MNKETREIVALTEKWLEKIKEITIGYEKAISVLAKAQSDYEAQTKKWWRVLFLPLLPIIIVLIIIGFILHSTCPNPVDINFQGLAISQHCNTRR